MQWQIFTITGNLSKEILVMFYLEIIFSSHTLKKKKINRQPYFHFTPNNFLSTELAISKQMHILLLTAAAKSLQSCPTLCNPIDGSPSGSPVPGILQARTLEWAAISFSNAWKWKVKAKSLSLVWLFATPWTAAHQAPPPMGFARQEYWSGCHHLLRLLTIVRVNFLLPCHKRRQCGRRDGPSIMQGSIIRGTGLGNSRFQFS